MAKAAPEPALTVLDTPLGLPLVVLTEPLDTAVLRDTIRARYPDARLYYVLANDGHDTALFKVTDNILGWACSRAEHANLGLGEAKECAWFDLPAIPRVLIERIDAFFRLVAQDLDTEAIVILTWDPSYDSDDAGGWGVLVPAQHNTSAHCSYAQDSIMADKPDHVIVVGTAHSHPGMGAFASHTDHHDQADFDGLHVTFGYPTGKPAEFHAEIQAGTVNFEIKPEHVLEPPGPLDPTVATWRARVTKGTVSYGSGFSGASTSGSSPASTLPTVSDLNDSAKRPKGAPAPAKAQVIIDVDAILDDECPMCQRPIDPHTTAWSNRFCSFCSCFLVPDAENLGDVIARRKAQNATVTTLTQPTRHVVYWHRKPGADGVMHDAGLQCLYNADTKAKHPMLGGDDTNIALPGVIIPGRKAEEEVPAGPFDPMGWPNVHYP